MSIIPSGVTYLSPFGMSRPALETGNPGKTNLIACWEFDSVSGNALDSHTNGLTLTNNNVATYVAGKVNNAARTLRTSSQYFSRTSEALLQVGNQSFGFYGWIQAHTNFAAVSYILSKDNNSAANRDFNIQWLTTVGNLRFLVGIGAGTGAATVDSPTNLSLDTWYFLSAWYDQPSGTLNIQTDNGVVTTTSGVTKGGVGGVEFRVGNRLTTFSNIIIDQLFFYKARFLSADERTWLYNNGAGRAYSELSA